MRKIVIIPAYNEQDNILNLIRNLRKYCPDYDYIIINDCSTDNTKEICKINNLKHINLSVNLGFSGAVQTGYKYAYENMYDLAIQIDGDGQHMPEYINTLEHEIKSGSDIVVGSRYLENKKPWHLRMIGSRLIVLCIFIATGKILSDPTSGMRAVGRKVMKEFSTNLDFIAEPDTNAYLLKNGFLFKEVQVEMLDRVHGVSHFRHPLNSIVYMLKIISSILFVQSLRGK